MSNSALEMSDEDFLKAGASTFDTTEQPTETADEQEADTQSNGATSTGDDADAAATDAGNADGSATAEESVSDKADEPGAGTATGQSADEEGKEEGAEAQAPEVKDSTKAEKPAKEKKEEPAASTDQAASIDYKVEYDKLLAPFQANGRTMSVKSVDDAITLMQMGANYNKKMAALKPNLKLMKTLENAGLLNEADISFMIDLRQKNPDAINKLVKDAGIDPMEIDADKAGDYKPTTRTVSDREMVLDEVLDPIKDSTHLPGLIELVSNKWDAASKNAISDEPRILGALHNHMEIGAFQLIMEQVENERMFGRLEGMSDFDAYKHVGDLMQAAGKFNHLGQGSSQPRKETRETPAPVVKVIEPKSSKAEDDTLKNQRRAASSTRPATASTPEAKAFNPLAMSDEEFLKQAQTKFL